MVLVALGALLTLPFWGWGPGAEEDAWGHIMTLAEWEQKGVYVPSRPPGHPVFEALTYPLYRWVYPSMGPIFLSALALGFSALALFRWMGSTGKAFYGALLFLVSFPALYAGSVALDYSTSLALGLWSAVTMRHKQPVWAGILLGLAGGSRLTFLLFGLSWLHSPRDAWRKDVLQAGGIAAITLLMTYAIPLWQWGPGLIHTYALHYPDVATLMYRLANKGTGLLAFPVLIILGWNALRKPTIAGWTGWAFLMLFLIYPHKGIFILPVWACWIAASWVGLSLPLRALAFGLVLLSPHLVHLAPEQACEQPSSPRWRLTHGDRPVYVYAAGPLWGEMNARKSNHAVARAAENALDTLPAPGYVIAGVHYAQLAWKFMDRKQEPAVQVVYYCNAKQLDSLQQHAIPVYHLPGQDQLNNRVYGINNTSQLSKPLLVDCP